MKLHPVVTAGFILAHGCLGSCGKKPDADAPAAALQEPAQRRGLEDRLGQRLTLEGRIAQTSSKSGSIGIELPDGAFVVLPAYDRVKFSSLLGTAQKMQGTLRKHMLKGPDYQDAEFIYLEDARLPDGTSLQRPPSQREHVDPDPFETKDH